MRIAFAVFALIGIISTAHATTAIESALERVHQSCGGISTELNRMKTMAGIGTAASATGTVAGGAAIMAGTRKTDVDQQNKSQISIQAAWNSFGGTGEEISMTTEMRDYFIQDMESWTADNSQLAKKLQDQRQDSELGQESKKLGDIRTGALAAATVTGAAGAVVGGMNMKKARGTLAEQVSECLASVHELSNAYGQARITRSISEQELEQINTIISACDEWSTVDLSKIDNRATGAMASGTASAAMGLVGTVTSAMANTEKMRFSGTKKEENLNKASNIMAGGTAVAGAAATIFNATQIAAIKRASTVANNCEGALN